MLTQSDGTRKNRNSSGVYSKAGTVIFSRIVLNTARRFAYPFAPALSRGLDVPLTAVTAAIGINQATGILGMIFGPISDRLGYRLMMLVGMSLLVIGMFAAGLLPMYATILAALFLAGLAKNIFDAAGLGRFIGAWSGGFVWTAGGINATAATAAVSTIAAITCLAWGLRGWHPEKQ